MAGSLVLCGQTTASLSDKLTELDELQTKVEQAETKSRKQAAKEERKNERNKSNETKRKGNVGDGNNARDTADRPRKSSNRKDSAVLDDDGAIHSSDNIPDTDEVGRVLGTFEATFYTAYCSTGCTGVTATGVDVSNTIYHEGLRVIAVDPAVIPLGTRVKVTLADGSTFVASAEDTGSNIKGNRIDILVSSKEEAYQLGRQTVRIEIL